jgi:hypothetical protein
VIRFSREKERSGWDWADLLLKVSVPVLILGLSTAFSIISAYRQEKIAKADKERQEEIALEQRESQAVASFIKEMQPLLIEKGLRLSAPGSEARGVARGLTLAVLSQVEDSQRKRLIIRFLLDSGLNAIPGTLIDLSEANLSGADLLSTNLSWANLSGAYLSNADLTRANLTRATPARPTSAMPTLAGPTSAGPNSAGQSSAGPTSAGPTSKTSNGMKKHSGRTPFDSRMRKTSHPN